MPPKHIHPNECLPQLTFGFDDAGGYAFVTTRGHILDLSEVDPSLGYCAVVAVAHATLGDFGLARDQLNFLARQMKAWKHRKTGEGETRLQFGRRLLCQWLADQNLLKSGPPRHKDMLYGTPSAVYGAALEDLFDFQLVFGEPGCPETLCICTLDGVVVLDGVFLDSRGGHVASVVNGIVLGTSDVVSRGFSVIHVWHSNRSKEEVQLKWLRDAIGLFHLSASRQLRRYTKLLNNC